MAGCRGSRQGRSRLRRDGTRRGDGRVAEAAGQRITARCSRLGDARGVVRRRRRREAHPQDPTPSGRATRFRRRGRPRAAQAAATSTRSCRDRRSCATPSSTPSRFTRTPNGLSLLLELLEPAFEAISTRSGVATTEEGSGTGSPSSVRPGRRPRMSSPPPRLRQRSTLTATCTSRRASPGARRKPRKVVAATLCRSRAIRTRIPRRSRAPSRDGVRRGPKRKAAR